MAHSKQARKRVRQAETRTLLNKNRGSSMRTFTKKFMAAVAAGDKAAASTLMPIALRRIDKAAETNVIHANAASRKKRQVMKAFNTLG